MNWKNRIHNETMKEGGFLDQLRADTIDEAAYKSLVSAIREGIHAVESETTVDRLVLGCLFEVPYEVENTREDYGRRSAADGRRVGAMAEELRELINEFLWVGLDEDGTHRTSRQ